MGATLGFSYVGFDLAGKVDVTKRGVEMVKRRDELPSFHFLSIVHPHHLLLLCICSSLQLTLNRFTILVESNILNHKLYNMMF